jgi:endonuclease/exonuclease/phosphatase family metal-dependent hydrolase
MSYNVHRCVGMDRRLDVARLAEVIAAEAPDIVALQEVDVGRTRTGGVDQAHALALRLRMAFHFNAALRVEEEQYGDAILTCLPHRLIKAGPLPGYALIPRLEPRGALWIGVDVGGVELQVMTTHFGLAPREQRNQVRALLGEAWLGAVQRRDPLIVAGDFNVGRRSAVYRTLAASLADARRALPGGRTSPTFPAGFPVLAIDHVFTSPGVRVTDVRVPSSRLARVASDHRPLIVDFDLA